MINRLKKWWELYRHIDSMINELNYDYWLMRKAETQCEWLSLRSSVKQTRSEIDKACDECNRLRYWFLPRAYR